MSNEIRAISIAKGKCNRRSMQIRCLQTNEVLKMVDWATALSGFGHFSSYHSAYSSIYKSCTKGLKSAGLDFRFEEEIK